MGRATIMLLISVFTLTGCGPTRKTLSIPTQPERMGIAEGIARGRLKAGEQYAYAIDRSSGTVRIEGVVPRFNLDFYLFRVGVKIS